MPAACSSPLRSLVTCFELCRRSIKKNGFPFPNSLLADDREYSWFVSAFTMKRPHFSRGVPCSTADISHNIGRGRHFRAPCRCDKSWLHMQKQRHSQYSLTFEKESTRMSL